MPHRHASIEIGLNAVIVSVSNGVPQIVHVDAPDTDAAESLPFGPFDPLHHRTFDIGLRAWVKIRPPCGWDTSNSFIHWRQRSASGDR